MKKMKKWIIPIVALVLGVSSVTAYAKAPIKPIEARDIKNKEAKKEFKNGVKAFNKEKYDEAATHFTAAEQAEPNAPEVHINLALALAKQGKTEEAKKHFDQAASLLSGGGASGGSASGGGMSTEPSPGQGGAPVQKNQPSSGGSSSDAGQRNQAGPTS